jgi:hypothetical protein
LFKGEAEHNLRVAETAAPVSDQIAPAVSTGMTLLLSSAQARGAAKTQKTSGPARKVEQPHSPFNRKAFAFIAREHGIYRGGDLHPIGRIQEDFEKFFAALVPRRHEREVDIHNLVHTAGIFFEVLMIANYPDFSRNRLLDSPGRSAARPSICANVCVRR